MSNKKKRKQSERRQSAGKSRRTTVLDFFRRAYSVDGRTVEYCGLRVPKTTGGFLALLDLGEGIITTHYSHGIDEFPDLDTALTVPPTAEHTEGQREQMAVVAEWMEQVPFDSIILRGTNGHIEDYMGTITLRNKMDLYYHLEGMDLRMGIRAKIDGSLLTSDYAAATSIMNSVDTAAALKALLGAAHIPSGLRADWPELSPVIRQHALKETLDPLA